jgi:hypothetical protein
MHGYRNEAPSMAAYEIDAEMVARNPCRKCGAACYYEPWTSLDRSSYRAYAVCTNPQCEHREEF